MTPDTTLRIERLIDASAEALFRAWTTREGMEVWYQDQDDWVVEVTELDVRVGGRYRVAWGPSGQPPYVEHGVYLEVDPPRRLVMTETLEGADPGWSDTTVTVELHAVGGKTRMVLLHEGFPSQHHRDLAGGGWPGFLDRIEKLVTGREAG
ncbi:MAG: SRPBCC family protein [Acidimicrobiales bacterium]